MITTSTKFSRRVHEPSGCAIHLSEQQSQGLHGLFGPQAHRRSRPIRPFVTPERRFVISGWIQTGEPFQDLSSVDNAREQRQRTLLSGRGIEATLGRLVYGLKLR